MWQASVLVLPQCVAISDRRVVSQYRSFVIMLGGADATHPTYGNTFDMGALCSFAVYGCMGPKIEVQETVNKDFYCAKQFLRPPESCAHGTSHACHTLDTPLGVKGLQGGACMTATCC